MNIVETFKALITGRDPNAALRDQLQAKQARVRQLEHQRLYEEAEKAKRAMRHE